MTSQTIHLGYEVGSGRPIEIPIRHLAVTGQTQESGKTTTLEALVRRSGLRAIAFVTKRGEGSFGQGRRVQPYFRDRADWQFVDQLLEAQLREKNKFLRSWIIRICRQTKTLADVQEAVKRALKKARGISEGVYTQLDAYLELIVPEIARARLAERIDLDPGLNVMDVSGYSTPMQMLFVQSAIDWVNAHESGVITIIPEAWEFIPEREGSPVKASAVALVRKGGGLKNYIWVDSQDMAGVDKVILRGCVVWLIGVQREANEIKRNLANIPADIKRPKPVDITALEKGQFFACFGKETIKTYVQPTWMSAAIAKSVATGKILPTHGPEFRFDHRSLITKEEALRRGIAMPKEEKTVTEKEAQDLREENKRLKRNIADLEDILRQSQKEMKPGVAVSATLEHTDLGEFESLFKKIKERLQDETPLILKVLADRPELQVEVERKIMTLDGNSLQGRVVRLLASGFFDEGKTQSATRSELKRTGSDVNQVNLWKTLAGLMKDGFLTNESGNLYRAVPGMKVNIVER